MSLFDIFPKKQAETPASIVTVDDAAGLPVAKMKVKLEPVQDLHGYDHPWPAGGGKNKFLTSLTTDTKNDVTATVNADGTISLTGTASAATSFAIGQFTFPVGTYFVSICPPGGSASTYRVYASWGANDSGSGLTRTFSQETTITFTLSIASGVNVSGLVCKPLICLDSESHTWEPYENICPISGWTGLTTCRTGKNMLSPHLYAGMEYNPTVGTTVTLTDSPVQLTDNGDGTFELTTSATWQYYTMLARIDDESDWWVKCGLSSSGNMRTSRGCLDENFNVLTSSNNTSTSQSFDNQITIPSEAAYYFILFTNGSSATATITVTDPQVIQGSSSDTYEPYNGSPYALDWTTQAGTVYHVTVDPVAGQLTVDMASVDLGSISWTYQSGYTYPYFQGNMPTDCIAGSSAVGEVSVVSSIYKSIANISASEFRTANHNNQCCLNSAVSTKRLLVQNSAYTDADVFKAAMVGQQLVYDLETPLTYQLTPQEIVLIKNAINNVWTDAGDILEFEYHTEPDYGKISGAFIDGQSLQDAGWFLKWRKLSAPKPKVDYTSIYGKDGSIDQTEALGDVFYEDRDVNLDMVYNGDNWNEAYSDLLNAVHGKSCMVQFTDDPYWYWSARLVANVFTHKPRSLEMSGLAFPYKLSILEKSYQATVSGATEGTATELQLEGSRMRVSPKLVVTGEITIKWGTNTKTLSAGTYYVRGLKVGLDGVTIKVYGTGSVTITYREGSL